MNIGGTTKGGGSLHNVPVTPTVEWYDYERNQWFDTYPSMMDAHEGGAAVTIGIYGSRGHVRKYGLHIQELFVCVIVIGGRMIISGSTRSNGMEAFDPREPLKSWTQLAELPERRTRHNMIVLRDTHPYTAWVIGGTIYHADEYARHVLEYDTRNNSWFAHAGIDGVRINMTPATACATASVASVVSATPCASSPPHDMIETSMWTIWCDCGNNGRDR
jgi:hypothetical protein